MGYMILNHSFKVMPEVGTVYGAAGSTTPVIIQVPREWRGKIVMVAGEGCQVYAICTSELDPAGAIAASTRSTAGSVASNKMTPGNTIPLVAANGAVESVLIPADANYIKVVNDAAAGFWSMYLSDVGRGA